ncbi:type II toxin-antitoxin system Phd/YefM family antitoxin [Schaalia sp. lx-100]|uniref:type II toxin-antitoxin system Phd/YefM family antitoxin n=1 Tax=Schaalia sp. lx-100 TaxID=2899081 RepID=UPI001E4993A1|nr:type II toxin-antitoxin system Phd/YefM family antitoxin [Schaalia sp. lx-100]MCD4557649.1 type II toxin-antitoxin system Phd/YefM family antitoxin [Schaalia sp. lx-100]
MNIDTNTLLSVSEANRNFSEVTKRVDQFGCAVILKNNSPRYVVLDFAAVEASETVSDDEALRVARDFMSQDALVYETLAK